MHCIHCGALLPEGAKFCTACGQRVQIISVESEPAPVVENIPVPEEPVEEPHQEAPQPESTPVSASAGYQAANAQLPPSYSNPNYSSQTGSAPAAPSATNGLAIAGFVCSLVFFPVGLGALTAIAGLILSIMGLSTAKTLPENKGHGLALAGTIISAVRIAITLILIIAAFFLVLRGAGHVGHEIISNWSEYVPYGK